MECTCVIGQILSFSFVSTCWRYKPRYCVTYAKIYFLSWCRYLCLNNELLIYHTFVADHWKSIIEPQIKMGCLNIVQCRWQTAIHFPWRRHQSNPSSDKNIFNPFNVLLVVFDHLSFLTNYNLVLGWQSRCTGIPRAVFEWIHTSERQGVTCYLSNSQ